MRQFRLGALWLGTLALGGCPALLEGPFESVLAGDGGEAGAAETSGGSASAGRPAQAGGTGGSAGNAGASGAGSGGGSGRATLADFCAKCADCVGQPGFMEGFCQPFIGPTSFNTALCAAMADPVNLLKPDETLAALKMMTCMEFDATQ